MAGWWSRVGATLIDGLIVAVPLVIVAALTGSGAEGVVFSLGALVVSVLYAPLLMARGGAVNGQTPGKQVTGIRVVHERNEPMSFGKGILRELIGKAVLGITVIYTFVDVLFPLFDERNQALHDKIGSTTVQKA